MILQLALSIFKRKRRNLRAVTDLHKNMTRPWLRDPSRRSPSAQRATTSLWVALSFAVTALTVPAHSADLRGNLQGIDTLRPSAPPEIPERRLYFWMQSNGAVATREARANPERDLAVIVTGPAVAEAAQPVTVTIAGGGCQPGTVVVTPNTVISLRNLDWFTHELYLTQPNNEAPIEDFGPEATAPSSQRSAQVRTAGRYVLHDRLNPLFRCWIVVGPGQGRVISPAADGTYRTSGLAEGDYTVDVWFEGRKVGTSNAHMGTRDSTVPAMNLAVPPADPAANGAAPGTAPGAPGAPAVPGAPGAPAAGAADAGAPAAPTTRRRRGR